MKYMYGGKPITPVVEIYHDVIPYLGGVSEHDFYWDTDQCVRAWKAADEKISDYFGDLLAPRVPSAAPLSYGHLVSLGAPLCQTEDAEPNVRPMAGDLDGAIAILREKQGMDFGDNGTYRHYREVNRALSEAFPGKRILPAAGYGSEGVITSAELLRGQDFFCDLYDEPEKVHEFLTLMNESVIAFRKFINRENGRPELSASVGLADDFASLIPAGMWSEFVIPYWTRYYEALGSDGAVRSLHCENTRPEQLRYLKDAGIMHYQPSVADALTVENVRENTDIPFDWLLYAYRITEMTDAEIEAWVDHAVEAGITKIRTQFGRYAWSSGKMDRILAFYRAFEKYRVE